MVFRVRLEVTAKSDLWVLRDALLAVGPLVLDDRRGLGLSFDAVTPEAAVTRAKRIVGRALDGSPALAAADVGYRAQESSPERDFVASRRTVLYVALTTGSPVRPV